MMDERAGMGAVGNLQRYMQFQTARAIHEAAKGGGGEGSTASAGMGLGLGVGFGAMMPGMIAQQMAAAGSTAPAAPAAQTGGPPGTPCAKCQANVAPGAKFCMACGSAVNTARFCHNCGGNVPTGAKFCGSCGERQL